MFEPLFLKVDDTPLGSRLLIHHAPEQGRPRGLVVYAHPFAEEMNKSRRMAALQARALAAQGFAVAQIDLLGCGDSAGDFGDASWTRWVDDIVQTTAWLQQAHPLKVGTRPLPLWLWGLRAGCLLAAEAGARLAAQGQACNFLFWQPAPAGKLLLQQFLRLKAAGELLAGQTKEVMEKLRAELSAGRPVEVAGYRLDPALCTGLERAQLQPPKGLPPGRLVWLEVSAVPAASLAPAGAATRAAWQEAAWEMHAEALQGPPFWQTVEIEDAPALIAASTAALCASVDRAASGSPSEAVHA